MTVREDDLQRVPLERASALAAHFYTDPAVLAMEQQTVFSSSWQMAAHVGKLVSPGDHVVTEIADKPIIVLRDEKNELRAFYNVCRHRAGPLATCNGKGAKTLRCRYHGWTYALDGRLRAAPEMTAASDFETASVRLTPVRVREWQGLVFVALSDATPEFGAMYDGIAERITPVDISAMRFDQRISYDVKCNWKAYVDNFLEGYHLPHVHPGLSKILDYRVYDTELAEWYSLQHSPLRDDDGIYGDGDAWYFFVFPNIMLNIVPGRLQTNRVVPLGVDRCRVDFDYYYSEEGAARSERDRDFSDEIQQEDIDICEAVQKGLSSGSYTGGRLSPKREAGVWHFQNLLRDAYRKA
jgi:choline monooxygenase